MGIFPKDNSFIFQSIKKFLKQIWSDNYFVAPNVPINYSWFYKISTFSPILISLMKMIHFES